jgi:hypothetical protein
LKIKNLGKEFVATSISLLPYRSFFTKSLGLGQIVGLKTVRLGLLMVRIPWRLVATLPENRAVFEIFRSRKRDV